MKKLVLISLLLISAAIWFGCKEEESTDSISGIVIDYMTGEPLNDALLTLTPTNINFYTGRDGRFEFIDLEYGQYTIVAQKNGYCNDRKTVNVISGETKYVTIIMTKQN